MTARIVLFSLLCGTILLGDAGCGNRSEKRAAKQKRSAEAGRIERDSVDEQQERLRKEEACRQEERLRIAEEAKKKEEANRLAAENEKKKKLTEEAAARRRVDKERESAKKDYRRAVERLGDPFQFAKTAPKEENPKTVKERKTFWCVFSSYASDQIVYEIEAEPGGVIKSVSLSQDGERSKVDAGMIMERLKTEKFAITSGKKVYVGGVRSPVGNFDVPEKGCDFSIMNASFGDFMKTAVALGMQPPDAKFKVCLKPDGAKNDKDNVFLCAVGYDDVIERKTVEEAIRRKLSNDAKRIASESSGVKRKKFKRTVMLYDGVHIKKTLDGVTMVPRTYRHLGTSEYKQKSARTEAEFRKKWQNLYDEAVRQEQMALEVQRENLEAENRAKSEHMRKVADAERAASDETALENELSKYKIFVVFARN